MDFMDISKKRITVRKFAGTPVEDEKYKRYWKQAAGRRQLSMGSRSGSLF